MTNEDLMEKVREWFAKHYEHSMFNISMEPEKTPVEGMKTVMAFLAQGVTFLGLQDERYLYKLAHTLKILRRQARDMEPIAATNADADKAYQFALIVGSIGEYAAEAIASLREHRG